MNKVIVMCDFVGRKAVGDENPEERFKRIAGRRTKLILEYLRLLGNCSNSDAYSYSEEEVDKIFSAIERELKRVKALFNKPASESFEL